MNTNENESRFAGEILKRMESEAWDMETARAVRARRKKRLAFTAAFSGAGLAAAALVVALATGLLDHSIPAQNPVHAFIAAQVEGTYTEVFSKMENKAVAASAVEMGEYDSMDEMIDATLAMR